MAHKAWLKFGKNMTTTANNNLILRKKIVIMAVAVFCLTLSLFVIIPYTLASSTDANENLLKQTILDELIVNGEDYSKEEILNRLLSVSVFAHTFTTPIEGLKTPLKVISSSIQGIFLILLTFITIYSILRELANGRATREMWSKIAVRFLTTIALVAWVTPALDLFDAGLGALGSTVEDIIFIIEKGLKLESTGMSFNMGKLGFFVVLIYAYIKIISYTILLELTTRKLFMPVGVVWLVMDGLRGPGLRFIKKYVAIYIRIIIIIVCLCFAKIFYDNASTAITFFSMFTAVCGMIGTRSRSLSLAVINANMS